MKVSGKKILLANTWDNKFLEIYKGYFSQSNDVRIHVLRDFEKQSITDLIEDCRWADIVWSQWASLLLEVISKNKIDALLVSWIRSYEILEPRFREIIWKNVHGVLFCGNNIKDLANSFWKEQIQDIPQATVFNCVEVDKYPCYKNGPGKNIAFVGRIEHKKGIALLAQCIHAAVNLDWEYKFHIAGAFNQKRYEYYLKFMLSQMNLTDHVIFYNWVENIPEFFKDKNYLLSTSPWEGNPNNVIEGLACGIKPIVHNWNGAPDFYPPELVFSTIDEFLEILSSENYNPESFRDLALTKFDSAVINPQIDEFIGDLVSKGV